MDIESIGTVQKLILSGLFTKNDRVPYRKNLALPRVSKTVFGKTGYFSQGRKTKGQMNATEEKYYRHLSMLKMAGEITEFWFEPIRMKIANFICNYTPDFMVLKPDGSVEFHEVKGCKALFMDDSKVKIKVAATKYPFKFLVVMPKKYGNWEVYKEYFKKT